MKKRNDELIALPKQKEDESVLRLRRVADSFQINERAKESIAQSQVSQFYDLLCAKLRQSLAMLEAKHSLQKQTAVAQAPQQSAMEWMLPVVLQSSPSKMGGGLMAVLIAMVTFGGPAGWVFRNLSVKATVTLVAAYFAQIQVQEIIQRERQQRMENVIFQFSDGASATQYSEQQIKEAAKAIALRYIDQIVSLNKDSHAVLADVICSRILRHFKRSAKGYEKESRKPLVAAIQRAQWNAEAKWHRVMTPPDRIPTKRALNLTQRCIRAITAERDDKEDIPLYFEPWFSPVRTPTEMKWTASGLLSQSGLRVREGEEKEAMYAHEFCDTDTYGFAYGDLFEAKERKMWKLATAKEDAEKPEKSKL